MTFHELKQSICYLCGDISDGAEFQDENDIAWMQDFEVMKAATLQQKATFRLIEPGKEFEQDDPKEVPVNDSYDVPVVDPKVWYTQIGEDRKMFERDLWGMFCAQYVPSLTSMPYQNSQRSMVMLMNSIVKELKQQGMYLRSAENAAMLRRLYKKLESVPDESEDTLTWSNKVLKEYSMFVTIFAMVLEKIICAAHSSGAAGDSVLEETASVSSTDSSDTSHIHAAAKLAPMADDQSDSFTGTNISSANNFPTQLSLLEQLLTGFVCIASILPRQNEPKPLLELMRTEAQKLWKYKDLRQLMLILFKWYSGNFQTTRKFAAGASASTVNRQKEDIISQYLGSSIMAEGESLVFGSNYLTEISDDGLCQYSSKEETVGTKKRKDNRISFPQWKHCIEEIGLWKVLLLCGVSSTQINMSFCDLTSEDGNIDTLEHLIFHRTSLSAFEFFQSIVLLMMKLHNLKAAVLSNVHIADFSNMILSAFEMKVPNSEREDSAHLAFLQKIRSVARNVYRDHTKKYHESSQRSPEKISIEEVEIEASAEIDQETGNNVHQVSPSVDHRFWLQYNASSSIDKILREQYKQSKK